MSFASQHLLPVSPTPQFPMVLYHVGMTFHLGEHIHWFDYFLVQGRLMLGGCPGLTVRGEVVCECLILQNNAFLSVICPIFSASAVVPF